MASIFFPSTVLYSLTHLAFSVFTSMGIKYTYKVIKYSDNNLDNILAW